MPECPRCGGLWVERDEESHCANCGNRTMPGHAHCFLGDSTIEERSNKRKARLCFEKRRNPQRMDMQKKKPGRPKGVKGKSRKNDAKELAVVDKLFNTPKTMPIREHPYILFLANKWEAIEDQIEKLKTEQEGLKQAAKDFEENYPATLNQ